MGGVTHRPAAGEPLDSPNPDIGTFQSHGFTLPQSSAARRRPHYRHRFPNPLAVTVTANNSVEPVAGGVVTFTAPSTGASANIPAATIGSNGVASETATANSTVGFYTVTASAAGAAHTVEFDLYQCPPSQLLQPSDQSITFGTSSMTVTGTLTNGSQAPDRRDHHGDTQRRSAIRDHQLRRCLLHDLRHVLPCRIRLALHDQLRLHQRRDIRLGQREASTLTISKGTPTITWANPSAITYGTALSAIQLAATASVPGSFIYTPARRRSFTPGNGQTLSVSFTPIDTTDYTTATATATINVLTQRPPSPGPMPPTSPTAHTPSPLSSMRPLVPARSITPRPRGRCWMRETTRRSRSPSRLRHHGLLHGHRHATINVDKAMPSIAWANPADITTDGVDLRPARRDHIGPAR